MLKVAVPPSSTSDSTSGTSRTPSKPGDVDADGNRSDTSGGRVRKKRRWSVCASKVKAGVLRARHFSNFVTSDSSSESGSGGDSQRDSDSGLDSGCGGDHDRDYGLPLPLKRFNSVESFADAPSFTVEAAHPVDVNVNVNVDANPDPAAKLCVVIPPPFDEDAVTPRRTPVGMECAPSVAHLDSSLSRILIARVDGSNGDGNGDGNEDEDKDEDEDGDRVPLSRSLSDPPLAGMALIDSLPLADGGGEGGGESTAWELSSSSGDDETNAFSGISQSHKLPESPGSYVARMQRVLAQVHQSTKPITCGTSRNPEKMNMDTGMATKTFGRHDDVNRTAIIGAAVASSEAARKSAVAPMEEIHIQDIDCWEGEEGQNAEYQPQPRPGGVEQHGPCGELDQEEEHAQGLVYVDLEEPESRRDLELLIAATSAMIGMMVPESYRWVLWLACSAVTVWFPLKNHLHFSFGWPPSWWSSGGDVATKMVDGVADQDPPPPPPYMDIDVDVDAGGDVDAAPAGDQGDVGDRVELSVRSPDEEKVDTNVNVTVNIEMNVDAVDSEQDEEGVRPGSLSVSDDKDTDVGGQRGAVTGPGTGTIGLTRKRNEQYGAVLAGLSQTELEFVKSAGEEEELRLLHQCLEYANYETAGAIKVCSTFCKFRIKEGWELVLSPLELEGPLRSRVHTLTTGRDRIGRGMITFSPGKLDMAKAPPAAYHKMLCYVLQEVLKDEELQAKGLVLLVDSRDVGFGLLRHFTMADYRRGLRMLAGAFPAKLKAIRILHPNRAISIALSIAMPLLSAKMRARVEVVANATARDGSFTNELAEPSLIPEELGIQGKWTGSHDFWSKWVEERLRVGAERRLAR
eukprot:g8599.t1